MMRDLAPLASMGKTQGYLGVCDVGAYPMAAARESIRTTPAIIVYRNGREATRYEDDQLHAGMAALVARFAL